MTVAQMERKLDQFIALVNWVALEAQKIYAEIQAARELEEALLEAQYQAACREAEEGCRMLEVLGNEDFQGQDYSEKYVCRRWEGGAV